MFDVLAMASILAFLSVTLGAYSLLIRELCEP